MGFQAAAVSDAAKDKNCRVRCQTRDSALARLSAGIIGTSP